MKDNEIKNMSVSERIKTMETLWSSFIYEDASVESPEWHGDILAGRKEKIEAGEASFISLDKLKEYYSAKN
jgi:putative addiction module component